MQMESTTEIAGCASAIGSISRRAFFAGAGAAVLPASVAAKTTTLEVEYEACVDRLIDVMMRLYPETKEFRRGVIPAFGSTCVLMLMGVPHHQSWSGEGFYDVRGDEETPSGTYYVKRRLGPWSNEFFLSGARLDDSRLSPAPIQIRPELIIKKLEGEAVI